MALDLSNLLTAALAVLALATAGGYGLLRGRVSALRDELEDERKGRESDRQERDDLRAKNADLRRDLDNVTVELEALTRVVTGEVHWVAIGDKLDHHHGEAKDHWGKTEDAIEKALDMLKGMLEQFEEIP
jgi:predicted phage gp36 major capsid-like protein